METRTYQEDAGVSTHCSKLMYLTTVALDSSNHRAQMSEEVSVKSTSVSCSQRAVQNAGSNHKHKNEARRRPALTCVLNSVEMCSRL